MNHRAGLFRSGVMAAALALGVSAPALASNSGNGASGGGSGGESGQQTQVTDQKLEQFAAAFGEIRSVRAEYVPKLQQAQGEQEKARLRQEGQQEMVQAIRNNGLKVSEYQQIGRQLNNDQQLRDRLKKILQEQQQGSGGSGQNSGSGSSQGSGQQ